MTLYIEPVSLWGKRYIKLLNDKMRDESPKLKVFTNLWEAKILSEQSRDTMIYACTALRTIVRELLRQS